MSQLPPTWVLTMQDNNHRKCEHVPDQQWHATIHNSLVWTKCIQLQVWKQQEAAAISYKKNASHLKKKNQTASCRHVLKKTFSLGSHWCSNWLLVSSVIKNKEVGLHHILFCFLVKLIVCAPPKLSLNIIRDFPAFELNPWEKRPVHSLTQIQCTQLLCYLIIILYKPTEFPSTTFIPMTGSHWTGSNKRATETFFPVSSLMCCTMCTA